MKPSIFIGSSSESVEIAEAIQNNLSDVTFPEIWDQSLTTLSQSTLNNLINTIDKFDFAIFVFGAEGKTIMRKQEKVVARDNVIFETGLFMGKLGVNRVFFVKPKNQDMHLPSDLLGITYGVYDSEHPNKIASLRPFCIQVKNQIQKLYSLEIPEDGIYGKNILSNDLFKLKSSPMRGGKITYGLYAKTSATQGVKVRIVNTTQNKEGNNLWYYDIAKKQGWLPTTYDGSQEFTLESNSSGILEIHFVGEGSATIYVTLNNDRNPYIQKDIIWL